MKSRTLSTVGAVMAVSLLAGCATSGQTTQPVVAETPAQGALEELKDISIEARHELRILAKAREAKAQESMTREQHEQRFFQATYVPDGFKKEVQFSYTGTATKAAEAVAMVAGYKFKTTGRPLSNEPWVRINLNNQPLNEALKELGLQTGDAIRIEVHPPAKLMRLIYKEQ